MDGLRSRPPPDSRGGEATRAQVARHQRERLFAATVAAVAERGYAKTTVEDLTRISGVARRDFYAYFDCKQDCFLAAVEELYKRGIKEVDAAYVSQDGRWDARMRAAFDELVGMICEHPEVARMCVVELYAAGSEARELADRAVQGFATGLVHVFGHSEERAGLPKEIAHAIVGGIHMLIHDHLRRGAGGEAASGRELRDRAGELRDLGDNLLRWALSYWTPPGRLRRGRAHDLPQPELSSGTPDERLLRAVAEIAAQGGYAALRVNAIARRGRSSLATLYKHFGGTEGAFLACYDRVVRNAHAATEAGYRQGPDWPEAIHAANRALLEYLASEPDFARVATVEVLAAGTEALERRDEAINGFLPMLDEGFKRAPRKVPRIWARATCFAVYSLIYRQISRYGPRALPRIGPTLTFIDLAPFLGAERAAEVANRPALRVAHRAR